MRNLFVALAMLLGSTTAAMAQFSAGVVFSGVSIGINLTVYPQLLRVPGYPVYYAPRANSNYFFYDGYYWVFARNNWYFSEWYNGPWQWVGPEQVPLFVLRVPVGYYRMPPPYFRGWNIGEPPRWGEHWGRDWEARHGDWQRWDRRSAPPPAPLPLYQQQFSGERYPHRPDEQHAIHSDNYRYQPRERARPQYPGQPGPRQFAPPERHDDPYARRDGRNDGREEGPSAVWQRPPQAPQYAPPPRQEPQAAPPAWQMQPPSQAQPQPLPSQHMPPQRQQLHGGPSPGARGDANERPQAEGFAPRETPRVERGNDVGREAGREKGSEAGRDNRNEARRGEERRPDERRSMDRRSEER
ncbi:hypothetical protein [Rhodocyclus tenuis]|uniref:hypothetical protein n=1 Tax=Rhodocyclus tenuis TaxID=1066 RepID=UPI0019042A34|nr:hypothetical protein [Rhodocyclus tenuis]MBK1679599.1 hypothetical protein [Rhodocyclus tenuis]